MPSAPTRTSLSRWTKHISSSVKVGLSSRWPLGGTRKRHGISGTRDIRGSIAKPFTTKVGEKIIPMSRGSTAGVSSA